MENLELKSNNNPKKVELRCKGWCHKTDKEDEKKNYEIELRCKGWCHDSQILEIKYSSKMLPQKYFC